MLLTFSLPHTYHPSLKSTLEELRSKANIVLPHDPLTPRSKNVILLYEKPLFSFYRFHFPLLQELNMRALLAVSPRYILPHTHLPDHTRLSIPPTLATQDGIFDTQAPFCTYTELTTMVQSGLVSIASSSHSFVNLTLPFINLDNEITLSKSLLENNLPQCISTFLIPFAKTSPPITTHIAHTFPFILKASPSPIAHHPPLLPYSPLPPSLTLLKLASYLLEAYF